MYLFIENLKGISAVDFTTYNLDLEFSTQHGQLNI